MTRYKEKDPGRRPKAHLTSVATTGTRRQQALTAGLTEGTPKGLARPRSAAGPRGARGRLRRRNVRPTVVVSVQGGGTGRALMRLWGGGHNRMALRRALAALDAFGAVLTESRGHLGSDEDARCGRGGTSGGRAAGGRGGDSFLFCLRKPSDAAGARSFGFRVCWMNRAGAPLEPLEPPPDLDALLAAVLR